MDGLTVGRIVHYVLPGGYAHPGEHRPAIVVKVWGSPPSEPFPIQLVLFLDGTNDQPGGDHQNPNLVKWATSVTYDPEGKRPGSWHWIERA
jgi:hypothetical protein